MHVFPTYITVKWQFCTLQKHRYMFMCSKPRFCVAFATRVPFLTLQCTRPYAIYGILKNTSDFVLEVWVSIYRMTSDITS